MAALRGVRPFIDVLFISLDFCRLVLWLMWTGLLRLLGRQAASWGPFCAGAESVRARAMVCTAAGKYGSLRLFQSLCPAAQASKTGERVCRYVGDYANDTYVPYWRRVVLLGLGLLVVWVALGVGGSVAWSLRPSREPGPQPRRVAVAKYSDSQVR